MNETGEGYKMSDQDLVEQVVCLYQTFFGLGLIVTLDLVDIPWRWA
jgi:hypothetical protein